VINEDPSSANQQLTLATSSAVISLPKRIWKSFAASAIPSSVFLKLGTKLFANCVGTNTGHTLLTLMPRPPNTWASALDALETAALDALETAALDALETAALDALETAALDALETAALEALYQTRLPRGRMATILEISTTEAVRSAAAAGLGDGEGTLAIWSASMAR
jgi:hypothetical protein